MRECVVLWYGVYGGVWELLGHIGIFGESDSEGCFSNTVAYDNDMNYFVSSGDPILMDGILLICGRFLVPSSSALLTNGNEKTK